jgi:hypothetical protein
MSPRRGGGGWVVGRLALALVLVVVVMLASIAQGFLSTAAVAPGAAPPAGAPAAVTAASRWASGGRTSSSTILAAAADGEADGGKKKRGWPVGRALRTFLQFNRPRLFPRRRRSSEPTEEGAVAPSMGQGLPLAHGVVLVTGATGGVGRRVVELLLKKGLRVRALARNRQKALAMLSQGQEPEKGSRLEVVQADVSDAKQLTPAVMEGVVAVVACTAAIVQPKVGACVHAWELSLTLGVDGWVGLASGSRLLCMVLPIT